MSTSPLDLVNESLVRLRVPPLASLEDRTAQSVAAATIYRNVVEELQADHPWSFALRERTLPKLQLGETQLRLQGHKYAYQLPPDLLRVLGLRDGGQYALAGDQLYTDDNDPILVHLVQTEPPAWPPHFRELVVFELSAAFALTLTDSSQRAGLMYQEAARRRPRARSVDAMQVPPHVFDLMRVYTRRRGNPLARG